MPVDLSQLHLAHPLWLWGNLVIPLVWVIYFLFYRTQRPLHQLEKFIDAHLIPHLLLDSVDKRKSCWKALVLWSLAWSCMVVALAGPRWSFREMEMFSRDQSLVILLDLSESMNATDVKPSRLVRAKQKIEDIINLSKGVKVGLIAFAADPHMITPITDDRETIRHLLPSLGTDLVSVQGSRLSSALEMASTMLEAEPGNNKALLVISDGGFEDASAITTAKKLAAKGIVIHVMGIGTAEGAPLQDHQGNILKKNGGAIVSKLEKERLNEINKVGNGHFLGGHYSDDEVAELLAELENRGDAQVDIRKKNKFWDEHFYLVLLPALPIFLWWFRRGNLFGLILILSMHSLGLQASLVDDYFLNAEERGGQALDAGDYATAADTFQDFYRKGVACYRAGNYAEAEKLFRESTREAVASSAAYNLGNSLVQQQKFKEAIAAYEGVLKNWPEHTKAKENLELVKKMLDQQQQDSSNSDESNPQEDHENSESKDQNKSKNSEDTNQQQGNDDNESQQDDQGADRQEDEEEKNEGSPEPQSDEDVDSEEQQGEGTQAEQTEPSEEEGKQAKSARSQEDLDADLWLNQIDQDPKMFLKNKFYIESKKNGTAQGVDPW